LPDPLPLVEGAQCPAEQDDDLDAVWNEMMNEAFAPPQVDEPPAEAGFAPSDGLAPVIESGSEDEEEQVPLEAPPPTPPLLLTCDAALTAPALAEPVGPVGPVEPVDLSDDAPAESRPRVPDLVAAIEAALPPEPPAPAEPPPVRPRRRGGPPMAVLMERMAVSS